VQAPHWAMPQPYFVPFRPNSSRTTQSNGVAGSAPDFCSRDDDRDEIHWRTGRLAAFREEFAANDSCLNSEIGS
jgi:hypothetical protein